MQDLNLKCTECDWFGTIEDFDSMGNDSLECPVCSADAEQNEDGNDYQNES